MLRMRSTHFDFMDIRLDNVSMAQTMAYVDRCIRDKEKRVILTLNVNCLVNAQRDANIRDILNSSDLNVSDGVPLLWIARLYGSPLSGRVNGTDLMCNLCEVATRKQYRIFFLGSKPENLDKTEEALMEKNPGFCAVGKYSPPFGFENDPLENERIVQVISDAKPDILFVALGFPKQEKWIWRYKSRIPCYVFLNVGGSFELVSGAVPRAPRWMQSRGLEWFWRILHEPRRLWKRYLTDGARFARYLIMDIVGRRWNSA